MHIGLIGVLILSGLGIGQELQPRIADSWRAGRTPAAQAIEAGAREPAPMKAVAGIAINTATVVELQELPGIGPKKAEQIIEARMRLPFRRPSDLRRVKGFGDRTIRRLTPHLSF